MSEARRIKSSGFNDIEPAAGRILISEPFTQDFFFGRSVVLLAENEEVGAFGVIVNKPLKIKIKEVFSDLDGFDDFLFLGGPVARERIFYVHSLGDSVPGSLSLSGNLFWGGDLERIKHLITAGVANPEKVRFFAGYSGWAVNQLNAEIARKSWLVSFADPEILMDKKPAEMWRRSVMQAGKEFEQWINYPIRPEYN
ncbi:MAG: hypothetical protein CVU06_09545 [Bacteroidetes bacterium HGW-Bacteroidetes-22]|nr:MAG: hypothetical protein CVU06_09545 [Bacteroidetes bacterium HGW-Bacteroidetes-22]